MTSVEGKEEDANCRVGGGGESDGAGKCVAAASGGLGIATASGEAAAILESGKEFSQTTSGVSCRVSAMR